MKITVYHPEYRDLKYVIRYRPTFDRVGEGLFTIQDHLGELIELTESDLFEAINQAWNTHKKSS